MPISANSEHIISYRLRLATVTCALLSVFVFPLPAHSENLIYLASDTDQSSTGYYSLSWNTQITNTKTIEYELQQSTRNNFNPAETIYLGSDTARVISGKPDGDYFYRVRSVIAESDTGPWSDTVKVTVAHHSLHRAMIFFIVGAIVFLSTLIYILRQSRP